MSAETTPIAANNAPHGEPHSGPLVWAAIISITCLLLFLFQKILWLVVPMLLALILYYVLVAPLQWLIYRGVSREASASIVILVFMLVVVVGTLAAVPWVVSNLANLQSGVARYVDGGTMFMDSSLLQPADLNHDRSGWNRVFQYCVKRIWPIPYQSVWRKVLVRSPKKLSRLWLV